MTFDYIDIDKSTINSPIALINCEELIFETDTGENLNINSGCVGTVRISAGRYSDFPTYINVEYPKKEFKTIYVSGNVNLTSQDVPREYEVYKNKFYGNKQIIKLGYQKIAPKIN